jgi:hypothetical protein
MSLCLEIELETRRQAELEACLFYHGYQQSILTPLPKTDKPSRYAIQMTFFTPDKLRRRKIEIDRSVIHSDSPEVQKRLDRIQENYQQLNAILIDLESKIQSDERLKAIDDENVDFEQTFGVKKKRKWRPANPKAKSKRRSARSSNPKKPR